MSFLISQLASMPLMAVEALSDDEPDAEPDKAAGAKAAKAGKTPAIKAKAKAKSSAKVKGSVKPKEKTNRRPKARPRMWIKVAASRWLQSSKGRATEVFSGSQLQSRRSRRRSQLPPTLSLAKSEPTRLATPPRPGATGASSTGEARF